MTNDGTSCYINAALVLLDAIPIEYLEPLYQYQESDHDIKVLKDAIRKEPSIRNTKNIRRYIADNLGIELTDTNAQEDANELLILLLDKLLKPNIEKLYRRRCSCGVESLTSINEAVLNYKQDKDLFNTREIMDAYIDDTSEGYWRHDNFDQSIMHQATIDISYRFGDFFIVFVDRFNSQGKKLKFVPKLEMEYTIKEYAEDTASSLDAEDVVSSASSIYNLTCIVDHLGTTVNSGHYVMHVLENEIWYSINDDFIEETDTVNLLTKDSYILLYTRVDS